VWIFICCNSYHTCAISYTISIRSWILIGWTLSKARWCSILPSRSPLAPLSYQDFPKGAHRQALTLAYQELIMITAEMLNFYCFFFIRFCILLLHWSLWMMQYGKCILMNCSHCSLLMVMMVAMHKQLHWILRVCRYEFYARISLTTGINANSQPFTLKLIIIVCL